MSKQYGLIPGNVFGSSDSEDDSNNKNGSSIKKQVFSQNSLQKKQIEKIHEQAVSEDASVFLYDEIFDDIQNKRNESKKEKKAQEAKKPKYINKLLETAEKRKKEYERRIERQVQKERDAEGEQFKDKESFVTSAYRKKLEEMKEAELLEKRQDYLESIGDVTKQGDLSGFYRHIYSQKMASDEDVGSKNIIKEEVDTNKSKDLVPKKKNYRKRDDSNDDEDLKTDATSEKVLKSEHLNSNIDADSDFSVESSSSSEDESNIKKKSIDNKNVVETKNDATNLPEVVLKVEQMENPKEEIKVEKTVKPKVNIWAKRTVGEAYVEAIKRYFERKALRESNKN